MMADVAYDIRVKSWSLEGESDYYTDIKDLTPRQNAPPFLGKPKI
jgi:hypothetical protein